MAGMTFASKLKDDASIAIPKEAVDALGLRPGDDVTARQAELHQPVAMRIQEADRLAPEASKQTFYGPVGSGMRSRRRREGSLDGTRAVMVDSIDRGNLT